MENQITTTIRNTIDNIANYYQLNKPNKNLIDKKEESKQYKCGLTEKSLSALNYRINTMNKKQSEKLYLRNLAKNKESQNVSIIDISEVDTLDNNKHPWHKLDNWQKKQCINTYIQEKYNDNKDIKKYLYSQIENGVLKKKNKLIEFDIDNQKLIDINIPNIKEYISKQLQ